MVLHTRTRRILSLSAIALATAVLTVSAPPGADAAPPARSAARSGGFGGAAALPASLRLSYRQVFLAGLPYSNGLWSIEATSRSDAWAVGGIDPALAHRDLPDYAVHWNGRRWALVHLPDPKFVPVSVRASSRQNVWIFGTSMASGSSVAEALRWDGAHWHVMTVPQRADLRRPVVLGPSDVWLSGPVYWPTSTHGWQTTTWHWNGRAWSSSTLPVLGDWQSDFIIAGSSMQNLWSVGTLTSGSRYSKAGRLAAYRWDGGAWHRMVIPRVYLSGPPQVAVAASGEVWIAGDQAYRLHGQPVVLYRTSGTWSRLPDRVLDKSIDAVMNPVPDGLNGVWFEFGLYWSGRAAIAIPGPPNACSFSFGVNAESTFMTGIPGTHSVLTAGGCQTSAHSKEQGEISLTRPR